jgi:hypothetical protein
MRLFEFWFRTIEVTKEDDIFYCRLELRQAGTDAGIFDAVE